MLDEGGVELGVKSNPGRVAQIRVCVDTILARHRHGPHKCRYIIGKGKTTYEYHNRGVVGAYIFSCM